MLHYWNHVETGIGGVMCFGFFSRFLFPSRFSATDTIRYRYPTANGLSFPGLFLFFFFSPTPDGLRRGNRSVNRTYSAFVPRIRNT